MRPRDFAPFSALAFADELAGCPDLLRAFARELGSKRDVRLVVYAPGWSDAELAQRLAPILAETGLDRDHAPEVFGVAVPPSAAAEEQLAAAVRCVYSRRAQQGAFASCLRIDDGQAAVLARWAREFRTANETAGILLVATGERCRREAAEAIAYLGSTNASLPVTVFTDDPAAFAGANADAVALEQPRFSFVDKIAGFLRAPYDRNLFIDTDAFVDGDARELLRLLDRFELAASHAHGRSGARIHDYESGELPEAFTQYNTAVVCFRRSDATEAVFRRWLALYEANPHHLHDQPSFRQAVYESELSVHALAPEWNFLVGAAYLAGPVRVVHGHGLTAARARTVFEKLNASAGSRVVLPSGQIVLAPPASPAPAPARAAHCVPARADIPALLNRLGLTRTGVEVGVKEGKYSATILAGWQGQLLLSVDPWLEAPPDDYVDIANVPQERQETFLQTTRDRLAPFGGRSEIWRMTGDEAASRIEGGTLDFVYLDARHDYESVRSDLEVWFPKLAPGGIIAGHDYVDGHLREGVFGVRSAVDEFFGAHGLPVGVTTAEPNTFPSWIVQVPGERKPPAVTVRRPDWQRSPELVGA